MYGDALERLVNAPGPTTVLQTHDDRFEKLYEQYDDDEIGALDSEDEGVTGTANTGRGW